MFIGKNEISFICCIKGIKRAEGRNRIEQIEERNDGVWQKE